MKHFEDIWNWAEKVHQSVNNPLTAEQSIEIIKSNLDNFDGEKLGVIILQLCNLSRIYNYNSAYALKQATQNYQIDQLDQLDPT